MVNFGTFGGKSKQKQAVQLTDGALRGSSLRSNEDNYDKDEPGLGNPLHKQNSEVQPSKVAGRLQFSQGFQVPDQDTAGRGRNEEMVRARNHQQLFLGGSALKHHRNQKLSHPQLMSTSTFSNGEIENGPDDFDEKMDQRQYQNNISSKSNWGGAGHQDFEVKKLATRGRTLQNGQAQSQMQLENEDDDDDGGFLSDEVDERRSYTPQPRGISGNVAENKDQKSSQPNAIDISSITLENEAANNATILNLSKISKLNN